MLAAPRAILIGFVALPVMMVVFVFVFGGIVEKQQFVRELEEVLELDANALKGDEVLREIPNWGSIAILGLLMLADEKYNFNPLPKELHACMTIDDLYAIFEKSAQ